MSQRDDSDKALALRVKVASAVETLAGDLVRPAALVDGIIYRGQSVVLAGVPNIGKTPLEAQLASCVAAGVPFLGLPTTRSRVCIIDTESDPYQYKIMLHGLWKHLGIDPSSDLDLFLALGDDRNAHELQRVMRDASLMGRWQWVRNLAAKMEYGLIIIDTLLGFCPFTAKDEGTVREMFDQLRCIRSLPSRPAVIMALHLRKSDRRSHPPSLKDDPHGWGEEVLGSVAWMANADVRLGMERLDEDGRLILGGYRRGFGALTPLILQTVYEGDHEPAPIAWERAGLSLIEAQIFPDASGGAQIIGALPRGVWFVWRDLIERTGKGKSTVSRFVKRARDCGLMEVDESGAERRYRLRTELPDAGNHGL